MILRRAFKLTLPSPSNTWKKLPTKSRPLETSSTSLNGSIALNKTTLRLVCGVDVHHMPLAVTVLHQMFVSDRNENLNSNPQSAYFITHELCQVSSTLKGIFVYLDLSPPHQPLPNGSDSRLTLVSPATLYMSPTSTSSPWYGWICPPSVSLTTQSQSSQPRGKPHYSALAMGNHTRL